MALTSVTVGAPDAPALAGFYGRLLDWPVVAEEADWAQVRPPDGVAGPTVNVEHEAHWRAPVWPSEPGAQHATMHLDIRVDDLDVAEAWATSLGARRDAVQPQPDVVVMRDPVGHPFCFFLD
ncbi:hypothetical protein SAMN05443575_0125 [Jatrophihabitans endophyticus]|uniref:Glyoxalase-like domain-containing protein n=2 Tax=Jatrophihabitans endophyticus TaxID=1206085 RepID=A0A1M5C6X9_9ACTN|nr:hypothetical protein SAMN05443575_0125 [Jatrophihabitans endophyticus]